jgi:hypothetical protein
MDNILNKFTSDKKSDMIIVLKNITPQDIESWIPYTIPDISYAMKEYIEFPTQFTNLRDWPTKCDICCWICDRNPKSYRRFIPFNFKIINRENKEVICDPYGYFDNWNCAIKYLNTEIRGRDCNDIRNNIIELANMYDGENYINIAEPIPKIVRKKYCGDNGMTDEEYDVEYLRHDRIYSIRNLTN